MQSLTHERKSIRSSSPKTGTPAPYGQACTTCAKAKCKCIYQRVGDTCERCLRLNKDCQPSVPNRRRNPKKTPGSRTAHLEEKLDDLVSLIRSQAAARSPTANTTTTNNNNNTIDVAAERHNTAPSTSSEPSPHASSTTSYPSQGDNTAATSPESGDINSDCDYPMDDETAEKSLTLFRDHLLWFSPIIHLQPTTTAKELRKTRPFLWLAIVACTVHSIKEAYVIGDKMRQVLANRMVCSYDRSIDMLQGMLIFLTWPHCQRKDRPFLSLWTNLGVTLAQDLGYMNGLGETAFTYVKRLWLPKVHCRPQPPLGRTMEDRRAVLALHVWNTMLCDMVRKDSRLRWTPFMEESLRMLLEHPEYDGDLVLAIKVRCSLITQQLTEAMILQLTAGHYHIPTYLHEALISQLQEIWRSLPASISQHIPVLLQLYATEVNIHEIALALAVEGPSSNTSEHVKRLELFRHCIDAIENWFRVFNRILPNQFIGLTFAIYVQLFQNIVTLYRLSRLKSIPGWDPSEVRNRIDMTALLDGVIDKMEMSAAALGISEDEYGEDSLWARSAKIMKIIRRGIQEDTLTTPQMPGMESIPVPPPDESMNPQGQMQIPPDLFLTNSFADDSYLLSSFFVSWDSMNF